MDNKTIKQIATWYQKTFKDRYYLESPGSRTSRITYNEEQGEINKQVLHKSVKELVIKSEVP